MDSIRHFTASDGVAIGYRCWQPEAADETPLLLLHGAASNGTRWWHFVAHSRLRAQHPLLRPDLRGHALSCWRGPAGMARWSDDLAELLAHAGIPRAIVVGHCLGANLAVQFAVRHPERCAGLVLVEPMVRDALLGTLARLRPWVPLLRVVIGVVAIANRLGVYRRTLKRLDLQQLDQAVQKVSDPAEGEAVMRRRYASPRHDLQTLPTVQYLANLVEVLRPLPLREVACPTLALLSKGRLMADPMRTRVALRALAEVDIKELDAHHWIPTEQPEAMCEAIDGWVGRRARAMGE